jgi:hypothetical protein
MLLLFTFMLFFIAVRTQMLLLFTFMLYFKFLTVIATCDVLNLLSLTS